MKDARAARKALMMLAVATVLSGVLVIPFVTPVHAAASLVSSSVNTNAGGGYFVHCKLPSVVAGNLLVVGIAGVTTITQVYDNISTNYVDQVSASASSANVPAYAYIYAGVAPSSAGHVLVTAYYTANQWAPALVCYQFSGVLSAAAAQTSTGTGTISSGTSASASVASITPGAQDLLVSSVMLPGCTYNTGITPPYSTVGPPYGLTYELGTGAPSYFCNGSETILGILDLGAGSYSASATASPTTAPWSVTWSNTWNSGTTANYAEVLADFTVATFTTTTTTSTTVTTTTTTCTSTITTTTTKTSTTTTTTTITTTVTT